MTFTRPRVNVVESDEGYSVQVLGRTGIEYSEGSKIAFVDSEILASPNGIAVFKNSIKAWSPPHEGEKITEDDKRRILSNISKAIQFQGQPIEIV